MSNELSRRGFNVLMLSTGAAYALARPLLTKTVDAADMSVETRASFAHPGMLHSRDDLKRMKDGVMKTTQPLYAGFEKLRSDMQSLPTYKSSGASVEIGRNPNVRFQEFDRDSNAAYQTALMWCITGNTVYAKTAKDILDSWSSTLRKISGADAVLCASLGGFKMANAAELLRHTDSGWTDDDAAQFGRMLRDVFLPVIDNFAPFANGNWDTAAMKMMIAVAIYGDDRPLFERALNYYRHGCGDGQLGHYIYSNGQCQESGRDQQHTQLGLAHMGDCCEMAWHQGLDLYSAMDNRLLLGFEYTARYNLGGEAPFEADVDQTGKYRHAVISPPGTLRPVYEQIYNHYVRRKGLLAPWTQQAAEKLRPEGAASGADHTGFGTLLYSREPGSDTEAAVAPSQPVLHASAFDGEVLLDFIPLAASTQFTIARAESQQGPYNTIARKIDTTTYRDHSSKGPHVFFYRVSGAGTGSASSPVSQMPGLPSGWRKQDIGAQQNSFDSTSFDGVTYRLRAAGSEPVESGGPFFFLSHAMPAKSRFVARLLPLIASQFLSVGLAVLDDTAASAVETMLLIAPRSNQPGQPERPSWTASLVRRTASRKEIKTIAQQPLAAPAIDYGRLIQPLWLSIENVEGSLHAAVSSDGSKWSNVGSTEASGRNLHAGLFLNSGINGIATEIYFDNVSVTLEHFSC